MTRPAFKHEGRKITQTAGLVEALAGEREYVKARIESATSAGNDTVLLKRKLVRIEANLAAATRRLATELHAVPGVAALMRKVEQLQSDLAAAQSMIERLQAVPAA
jgi:predicted RNase H-like nuclease (RuvC/YqgF family)